MSNTCKTETVEVDGMRVTPETAATYRFGKLHEQLIEEYGEAAAYVGAIAFGMIKQAEVPKAEVEKVSASVGCVLGAYDLANRPPKAKA